MRYFTIVLNIVIFIPAIQVTVVHPARSGSFAARVLIPPLGVGHHLAGRHVWVMYWRKTCCPAGEMCVYPFSLVKCYPIPTNIPSKMYKYLIVHKSYIIEMRPYFFVSMMCLHYVEFQSAIRLSRCNDLTQRSCRARTYIPFIEIELFICKGVLKLFQAQAVYIKLWLF